MLNKKISLFILPLIATLSVQANDPFFNDPFGDDIFKEMMQMQQEMDKMFDKMHQRIQQRSQKLISPLGTYKIASPQQFEDKGDHYEYLTNIPENKENQIDIKIKDSILGITAKIIQKQEQKTANSYSTSSSMRMYQQSIPLPKDADEATLNAEYVNKRLLVTLKKKTSSGKTIHIAPQKTDNDSIQKKSQEEKKSKTNTDKEGIKPKDDNLTKHTINSDLPSMS